MVLFCVNGVVSVDEAVLVNPAFVSDVRVTTPEANVGSVDHWT